MGVLINLIVLLFSSYRQVLCQPAADTSSSDNHLNISTLPTTSTTAAAGEESSATIAIAVVVVVLVLLLLATGCIALYYCVLEDLIKKYKRGKKSKRGRHGSRSHRKSSKRSRKRPSTKITRRNTPGRVGSAVSKKTSVRPNQQGTRPAPLNQASLNHNSLQLFNNGSLNEPKSAATVPMKRVATKRRPHLEKKTSLQKVIEKACKNVNTEKRFPSNSGPKMSRRKPLRKASKRRSPPPSKKVAPKSNNSTSRLW